MGGIDGWMDGWLLLGWMDGLIVCFCFFWIVQSEEKGTRRTNHIIYTICSGNWGAKQQPECINNAIVPHMCGRTIHPFVRQHVRPSQCLPVCPFILAALRILSIYWATCNPLHAFECGQREHPSPCQLTKSKLMADVFIGLLWSLPNIRPSVRLFQLLSFVFLLLLILNGFARVKLLLLYSGACFVLAKFFSTITTIKAKTEKLQNWKKGASLFIL